MLTLHTISCYIRNPLDEKRRGQPVDGRHVMTPDPDDKQLLEFVMTNRKKKKNRFPFCSFLLSFFLFLDNGTSLDDILGSLALVLGEVLAEELAQLDNLGLEAVLASGPSLGGVEKL